MTVLLCRRCGQAPGDGHRTAWELLDEGALELFGIAEFSATVKKNGAGKPYSDCYPDVQFSISHTKHAAFCVFSDREVGLDCEEPRRIAEGVKERWLGGGCSDAEALVRWTRLESLIKLRGVTFAEVRYDRDVKYGTVAVFETVPCPLGPEFTVTIARYRS